MMIPMVQKALCVARFLRFATPAIASIIAALTILIGTPAGAQTITTAAGNGTASSLNQPRGVAFDASGSMYIADTYNHRIQRITTAGTISTFAGTGIAGYSGDDGPAAAAMLNQPGAVAFDGAGNLFIADSQNRRIRKVNSSTGIITTIAGTGTEGFSGDNGLATLAMIRRPMDLTVDTSNNLYFADSVDNRVRKISPAGIITTVAGTGVAGFSNDFGQATAEMLNVPVGVALDSAGNLYIADARNHRIRKVSLNSGFMSPVAGNGTGAGTDTGSYSGDNGIAGNAGLNTPEGIAVDAAGNLYIADMENYRIRKVTASNNVITTIAGTGADGFSGDGGLATQAKLNLPWSVALDAFGNVFFGELLNNRVRKIIFNPGTISLSIADGGAGTASTNGSTGPLQAGYALVDAGAGSSLYGTAVFSIIQNNVVVSEVGVPASAPTKSARIFIDFRSNVPAVQGQISGGTLDINTGLAVVSRGFVPANVTYTLRGTNGKTLTTGHGTLAASAHFAKFIDQLKDVAQDFSLPADFASATGFGSLEITSDQPVSILALRLTINQRGETIFTSTPIADLQKPLSTTPIYFPQFADGGGYVNTILLLNTSNAPETGIFSIFDDNGGRLIVNQVGGTADSSFAYAIPAGGVFVFQTDGFASAVKAGSIRLTPDPGTSTPIGSGIFRFSSGGVLVTESGVPTSTPTTHARVFVDTSGGHDTGLAIAAPGDAGVSVTVKAFEKDGRTRAGDSKGPLNLVGNGHRAAFVGELLSGLPSGFIGVLDISSATPFVALTMRSLTNVRKDFLLTTFPIADANQPAPSLMVFPQIADGGGYTTHFILLSTTGAVTTTINLFGDTGAPLALGK